MKQLLFACVFFICASNVAKAQSLKLGIKGGADINKIKGKGFSEQFTYGYQAGVFAEIGFGKKIGIQPELILSQVKLDTAAGFKEVYQLNNFSKSKLNYVKIPILLTYKANDFVKLQLGPQFSKLLDKSKSFSANGKDIFSSGDFSMVAGIQINVSKIRVYGRYAIGLNNINETGSPEKWKNQNFQIGLGLTL